jgi:hypothetical protein
LNFSPAFANGPIHLSNRNGQSIRPMQKAFQPSNVLGGWTKQYISVILDHKIEGIAGLQPQVVPNRFGNDRLPFAG